MRAISSFSFEDGISTRSCSALLALRMRVSMSATGSVSIVSSYQELFVMPGMTPWWASSRRQIRQSPNFLNTARGRPYLLQRLYARADRHPLADLELGDRLLRPAHLRPLARDDRELLDRRVEQLGLGLRLADAHVERDLRDPRDLHDRLQAELPLQLRAQLVVVAL